MLAVSVSTAGETWYIDLDTSEQDENMDWCKKYFLISFLDEVKLEKQNCIVCSGGRQSRLPFSQKVTRAKHLLELIHADVYGPMENKSIGGSWCFPNLRWL